MDKGLLVLGGSSDIARSTAREFAERGFDLVLAGRNTRELKKDCDDFTVRYGIRAEVRELDILNTDPDDFFSDEESVPAYTLFAIGELGSQETDQQNSDRIRQILDVNFSASVPFLEKIAGIYENRKQGSLMVIGSVAGDRGRSSNYLYGSAKAGLEAWASGARNRLAKSGAHVLTIKPGFVKTSMTENLELPGALTVSPERVAKSVFRACMKKKNVVYIPWFWWGIMGIIKNIPERVFKKLSL